MRYGPSIKECMFENKGRVLGNVFRDTNKNYDYRSYSPNGVVKSNRSGLYFKLGNGQIRSISDSLEDKMCLGPFSLDVFIDMKKLR